MSHEDQDHRLRRVWRKGLVRPAVVPGLWRAPGIRGGRAGQAGSRADPGRGGCGRPGGRGGHGRCDARGRRDARLRRRARSDPLPLDDAAPTGAAETQTAETAEPAAESDTRELEAEAEADAEPDGGAEPAEVELEPAAFSLSPEPTEALPAALRTPFDGPEPILIARPYVHRKDVTAATEPGHTPPSAYRPPVLALSAAATAGAGSSGSGSWPSQTMTVAPRSSIAAAEAAAANAPVDAGDADELTRFAEIGTWFVIVGAAMAVLGFLLPWSHVVIGSRSLGGYLDSWGLASPTHVVVLLASLAILALGIMRTKVPVWLWAGVFALGLGGMLVGLTWPYQFGPLGADVGVIVVALGGAALLIGGGVTTWATRHVEVEPVV